MKNRLTKSWKEFSEKKNLTLKGQRSKYQQIIICKRTICFTEFCCVGRCLHSERSLPFFFNDDIIFYSTSLLLCISFTLCHCAVYVQVENIHFDEENETKQWTFSSSKLNALESSATGWGDGMQMSAPLILHRLWSLIHCQLRHICIIGMCCAVEEALSWAGKWVLGAMARLRTPPLLNECGEACAFSIGTNLPEGHDMI